jgi:hypothetical protein
MDSPEDVQQVAPSTATFSRMVHPGNKRTFPLFQAQLSARISMITRDELLYQTTDETPRCIIVRMPTPPSAGNLLARMRHRAIQLAHS